MLYWYSERYIQYIVSSYWYIQYNQSAFLSRCVSQFYTWEMACSKDERSRQAVLARVDVAHVVEAQYCYARGDRTIFVAAYFIIG